MYTLFIDTHSKKVIVVLYKNKKVLIKKEKTSDSSHSSVLMSIIESVFNEAKIKPNDLEEIIVVNGPGSFTGIRIGITVAKTFAFLLNIAIKEIDYFHVLLSNCNKKVNKQVIIADPNGFYVGLFDNCNNKLEDYFYTSTKNFAKKDKYILIDENINIDYNNVYLLSNNFPNINSHLVKPLYIKKIGVEK